MAIDDIIQRTGAAWGDKHFVELALRVTQEYPELKKGVLIGGLAARLLTNTRYKGRSALATDVDFLVSSLPDTLRDHLQSFQLIKRISRSFGSGPIRDVYEEETGENYSVFKFPQDGPYKDVDVFVGRVGGLKIDALSAVSFGVSAGHTICVAAPGLLLATQLKPESFTHRRGDRARFVLESLAPAEFTLALDTCHNLFSENHITRTDFDRVQRQVAHQHQSGRTSAYRAFVSELYNRLKQ